MKFHKASHQFKLATEEQFDVPNFQTTPPNAASLAVQELHDGLQDVVGVLGDAAGVPHVGGAFHLSQDVSHLLHVLLDVRLEAAGAR